MQGLILSGILISTYLMFIAKRISALIRVFTLQSFFLFLATYIAAKELGQLELYIVAGLLLVLKVLLIPILLGKIINRIKVSQDLGLFINAQISLFCALFLTFLAWVFSARLNIPGSHTEVGVFAIAFFVVLTGLFLMISRATALAQIIGLLAMENGLFLFAATVSGGMPFFVEIAIFFDVFVSVIIMGLFVYKINNLFTHIDVNKLTRLKG